MAIKKPWENSGNMSFWRWHPESNWGIEVLQTSALPLGYVTNIWLKIQNKKMERKTRLELATPTLARWCSTNWAISALEVTPRIELGNRGFADLGLTAWLCHQYKIKKMERKTRLELATPTLARWCSTNWAISASCWYQRRKWRPEGDLNPWPPPWQGGILTN